MQGHRTLPSPFPNTRLAVAPAPARTPDADPSQWIIGSRQAKTFYLVENMIDNGELSRYILLIIVDCFCVDIGATKAACLLHLNCDTINRHYNLFRHLGQARQMAEMEKFVGIGEVDENFFSPARVRGRPGPRKRGRGFIKQPVFGIYERNGRVYECEWRYVNSRGQIAPGTVANDPQKQKLSV
jgi:hypothetical protein